MTGRCRPFVCIRPFGLGYVQTATFSDRIRCSRRQSCDAGMYDHNWQHSKSAALLLDPEERLRMEAMAHRLYILAWVIEGVAVSLGLGMALSLNATGDSSFAEFLLGGGGFVMVACAELAKIPLATFIVESVSKRAKLAALTFLLLMSFITFETIFMSLERGFHARMVEVRTHQEQLHGLQTEYDSLTRKIADPGSEFASTRAKLNQQIAEVDEQEKLNLEAIRHEREQLWQQNRASNIPKEIEAQIQALEAKRPPLIDDREKKIAAADNRARALRDRIQRELTEARRANDAERAADALKRLNEIAWSHGRERNRIDSELRNKITEMDSQIESLIHTRARLVQEAEFAIKPRLDELTERERVLRDEHQTKRDELRRRLDELHLTEATALKEVSSWVSRRSDLAEQIRAKQRELRNVASGSQLHRLAVPLTRLWTGEEYSPETIPETAVKIVSVIWFGSMAALGAIGGSVIAMVSQLLRKRASRQGAFNMPTVLLSDAGAARRRFWQTLRRMLVQWRFYRVKTKKVEVVKVEPVREIIAVPIPASFPYEKFKKEYEQLNVPLASTVAQD